MEEKQKSYGKIYKNVTLKHKFSCKFWAVTISACILAVIVISVLGQTVWAG